MTLARTLAFTVLLGLACADPGAKPLASPGPSPKLEPLDRVMPDAGLDPREALYQVAPFDPVGPPPPPGAVELKLDGERTLSAGQPVDVASLPADKPVLLVPDEDTYLAQVAGLLMQLDDAGLEVWLKHPEAPVAFRLDLRDEPTFQRWLEDPVTGKLRIVQRADGFELQTNMGKLPGPDPNGPSVPTRGGHMDLATLHRGLERLKGRFGTSPDVCFMPSFGTAIADVARAMAANRRSAEEPIFTITCLVYPARRGDAGVSAAVDEFPAEETKDYRLPILVGVVVPLLFGLAYLVSRRRKGPTL